MIKFLQKFKKWIISFLVGGTALASGLSGIPQDFYNNLNVKVYSICDLQSVKRTSIADDLTNFKARNPDNSLRGLNASERANLKSCEIAKRGTEFAGIYNSAQYGTQIEIIGEVKNIEINGQHGIELFAKAWKGGQPLGFGKDGSVEIERFRIFNPPILVDDPNGTIIREWTDIITGELKQRKLREDPLEAIRQVIAHNVKIIGIENAPIVLGKVGNTTSTFYPAAGANSPVDGDLLGYHAGGGVSFASVRDASTGDAGSASPSATTGVIRVEWFSDNGYVLNRGIFLFDTSAIGSTDTVDSAVLSLNQPSGSSWENGDNDGDDWVGITTASPASNSNLVSDDWDQTGGTTPVEQHDTSERKDITNYNGTSGYIDWAFNSVGIGNINQTGISKFAAREGHDMLGNASTASHSVGNMITFYYADQDGAGTTQDPKLVVVHTAPSAGVNKGYIIIEE